MSTSMLENSIYSALQEHERLRYGELKKLIVDERKIRSERPFRESLQRMVQNGLIKKYEIARNNVVYTINSEILMLKDEDVKEMLSGLEDLKNQFDDMKKLISSEASDADKVSEIMKYLKFLAFLEMQAMMLAHISGKSSLTKHANNIFKLKRDYLALLSKRGSNEFSLIAALVNAKFFLELLSDEPDALNEFADGIRKFMNSKRKNKSIDIKL